MKQPKDLQFLVGMMDRECGSPYVPLPECKDTLFVTKPFEKYEPYTNQDSDVLFNFTPDADNIIKRKFESESMSHAI